MSWSISAGESALGGGASELQVGSTGHGMSEILWMSSVHIRVLAHA